MRIRIENQLDPFFETMMLLSHTEEFEVTRKATIDALNDLGLDGEAISRKYLPIYEKYVLAFQSQRFAEPINAFWLELENEELSFMLMNLLYSFKDSATDKKPAEAIWDAWADIFSETDINIDENMMKSARADLLMAEIEHKEISSKDKWIWLQMLLRPEDSINAMLQWVNQNIPAFNHALQSIEHEYQALLDQYLSYMDDEKCGFRSLVSELGTVSSIYPSLASPLNQLVLDETAFCGMLTYIFDSSSSADQETMTHNMRVGWKVLADKSKMEILRLLKNKPMYNQEIAETLGLTAATVSYHMNALMAGSFVSISKSDGRVYYNLKKSAIESLLDQTRSLLVD